MTPARRKQGRRWTTEDVECLRELLAAGLSHREIGEHLGRSKQAVAMFVFAEGLAKSKPRTEPRAPARTETRKERREPKPEYRSHRYVPKRFDLEDTEEL